MRSLTLLTLALTLTFSTMARSYQVARVHGVITKISGDRVKVQDDKNQIFWVERTKAYPIGSQIGDDVVIYQKVRFKSSFNNNTTTFFIKNRKIPMVKAIRNFFVSHEKRMGFKYKKKKKYTFYDRLQNLFSIEEAHAQASVGKTCYVGGRKSKLITVNNELVCEEIVGKYSCGENNEGFRCSPAIFYKKEISKKDSYLQSILHIDDETKDKGFCVKHDGSNITRRCYNAALKAFGSEAKADELESRERVIENLYANLDEDQEAIDKELAEMVKDIDELCTDKEDAIGECGDFVQDIEAIENDLLDWAGAKEIQKEADELEIRTDEAKKVQDQVIEYLKKNGFTNSSQGQPSTQPYLVTPQGSSQQQANYQIMLGNQTQGHNPIMAQMAQGGMQQPVIFIVIPNQVQGQNPGNINNNQVIQGLIDYLKISSQGSSNSNSNNNQKQNVNEDNDTKKGNKSDEKQDDKKPNISLSTYSYANKLENCKVYSADICLVKQSDESFKNYKNVDGEYEEFEAAKHNEENGTIDVNDQSFLIDELKNMDPSLKWSCEVLPGKTMESDGSSCLASEVSCDVYDEDNTVVAENRRGYLSSQHAQAFGAEGGSLTYEFNSYNKKSTVSPALPTKIVTSQEEPGANENGELTIEGSEPQEFTGHRNPPLFYSPCEDYDTAKDNELKMVRADNKSCVKIASYPPTPCEHGNCEPEAITVCKTDVSCQVEYKNAFNKLISDQTMDVTLDCACEIENPEAVDIASCMDSSQATLIDQTGKDQPGNKSSQQ